MADTMRGSPRFQLVGLVVAALWSIGLLVAGFTLPFYEGTEVSSTGATRTSRETLVGENGGGVVLVLAVPLAVTLLVGCILLLSRRRWAAVVAVVLTALLGMLNILAMLTIGLLILPVTLALALVAGFALINRSQAAV